MSSESLSSGEDSPTAGLISNMEARADHQILRRFNFMYGLTTCLGVVLAITVLAWILHFREGFGIAKPEMEFYWHPMLMILGFIFIYSQSMLVYRTARNAKKKLLKIWHASLHCAAFIFAILALKAAFDSHNYATPPKPNLYTLHSWIGLTTIIMFAYQFVAGFVTFLFPGLSKSIRSIYLPVHTHFGVAIFILAIVTAMMGFTEKTIWTLGADYSSLPSEGILVNFIGVLLISFGILVVYLVNDQTYKRVAIPEDEVHLAERTN